MGEPARDLGGVPQQRVERSAALAGDSDTTADDDTVVAIQVSHGSLEEAEYAVMVGTFADEMLSGTERFLDRQLGGVLTATHEASGYPGAFDGNALFIRPHPVIERRTSPPGAYVVGLGRSVELTRTRVRHAVGRALVDRCLQIENWPADDGTHGVREVGVSATLLGVRNGDGVSVSESVAGIVEGVIDANRSLARYEAARRHAGAVVERGVRVTELELIERFADRADLAAMMVRRLPNTVQLGAGYVESLADVVVARKRGGLPAGAALADRSHEWPRFAITSVADDEPADGEGERATLTFDVSFLGGEARADRVLHRIDRVAIDALAERLSVERGDDTTAATLYDLLVPEQMRHLFQTAPSVQLIVDETSANYPWELLSAPTPAGRTRLATQAAVVRQFSETAARRVVVERASRRTALVIGAGNVPGVSPLPGALREARQVADALTGWAGGGIDCLDDSGGELSTVDVMNALDGDHQIIHIASHGEYVEGDPTTTGARLNAELRLRAETVRQLRHVPDLVVLNCCTLGRVGTARLAAGLAREFMAIGARAVIAAGWAVGDTAAEAFAATFYRHLLEGVSFSGAVAAARNAAFAAEGGRETWAAYQCYGDPELVLAGGDGPAALDEGDPVSVEDLLRRLKGLEVRASDLGRPVAGRLERRRDLLIASLTRYTTWAEAHGVLVADDRSSDEQRVASSVQRQLARVAAELGEYRDAAARYLSLVSPTGGGSSRPGWALGRRWSNVEDLQQASNCLSRAAQRDVRAGAGAAESVDDLRHAVELARRAVEITGESESFAILGGALKRLATVVTQGRDELVRQAADAYERRHAGVADDERGGADGPYTRLTAAQLAMLVDREQPVPEAPATAATRAADRPARLDSRAPSHADYWAVAAAGDHLLTRLLACRAGDDVAPATASMVGAYEQAFASRSTWRERASSIDHLCDLRDLLGDDDPRRACLGEAIAALERWELDNVMAEAGSP